MSQPKTLTSESPSIVIQHVLAAIRLSLQQRQPALLVALDGGSGAGKSTFAAMLAAHIDAVIVPLDDFFSAHIPDWEWDTRSVAERAGDVFDWQRLRADALLPLLAGQVARWHAFDFAAGLRSDGTYALSEAWQERQPAAVILLEGAYSSSPQLSDVIDLTVLIDVDIAERHRRLALREDAQFLEGWHRRWDAVEAYYFQELRPKSAFDVIISG